MRSSCIRIRGSRPSCDVPSNGIPGPKGGRLENRSRDICCGSIADEARCSHCFCWVRESPGLKLEVDVLRERGASAPPSVSSSSEEGGP